MNARNDGPLPESAMGGASDAGAHGKHPASAAKLEGRSARPEDVPGDAAIERRHHRDESYNGPERRAGAVKHQADSPG
jgi:hypothetical protein